MTRRERRREATRTKTAKRNTTRLERIRVTAGAFVRILSVFSRGNDREKASGVAIFEVRDSRSSRALEILIFCPSSSRFGTFCVWITFAFAFTAYFYFVS